MVILPIKKKWFDMILSGEKKEEYRTNSVYWRNRIFNQTNIIAQIRNGYGNSVPWANLVIGVPRIGFGNKLWGAPEYRVVIIPILIIEGFGNLKNVRC